MNDKPERLILVVTASFLGAIGYGDVYRCRVVQVILGDLEDQEINLTILAGDRATLTFMSDHVEPVEIEIGCRKRAEDEPYFQMPISGFIDHNRTSWEIEYTREAAERLT